MKVDEMHDIANEVNILWDECSKDLRFFMGNEAFVNLIMELSLLARQSWVDKEGSECL